MMKYSGHRSPFLVVGLLLLLQQPLSGQRSEVSNSSPKRRQRATRVEWKTKPQYVPGELLVRFRRGATKFAEEEAHRQARAEVMRRSTAVEGLQRVRLASGLSVEEAIARYRKHPDVLYAEPNYLLYALDFPDDPGFPEQWGLHNTGRQAGVADADIDAPEAWSLSRGSSSVVVAVIDSGLDYTHPDLAPNLFRNPGECTANGVDDDGNGYVDDCHGISTVYEVPDLRSASDHGTHVAGIIGAAGNNTLGVSGVNWNISLMACKFLDTQGTGNAGSVVECYDYIKMMKDRGVNIVATNNSYGGPNFSQAMADAIEAHRQRGILFVAAAGNDFLDNDETPVFPANFDLPNVISVAATDRTDDLAAFSNVGQRTVHLGAPGHEILSTVSGGSYAVFSGTSMAAPHVAGVVALLKAQDPTRDWRSIKNLLMAGGDPLPALQATISGRRLNAYGAMTCTNRTLTSRLKPLQNLTAASVGQPLTLAVLNINCEQPAGEVVVTVSPGGQTLTLKDDGAAPDLAANDGIYSGQFLPPSEGVFLLDIQNVEAVRVMVLHEYTASEVPYSYRSIAGTSLELTDDSSVRLPAPFPLSFGGVRFDELYVSSNGTISFSGFYAAFFNEALPTYFVPTTTLVATFWDDLYPIPGSSQNVFWEVQGTTPNRELVIEWRDVRAFECRGEANTTVTFQAVFREGSDEIQFNYSDATFGGNCYLHDRGGSATVGIQVSPTAAYNWHFGQGIYDLNSENVHDGMSITWRLAGAPPPPNPVPAVISVSPTGVERYGPAVTLTVRGTDFVPGATVKWNGNGRVTSFVSSTLLNAFISAADLNNVYAREATIQVANPQPGGGTSNAINVSFLNPVPVIQTLSPNRVMAGGFSFSLKVTGTGFFSGSVVRWNGQDLPTHFASSTELLASVSSSYFTTPGNAQITVFNPTPSGGTSLPAFLTIDPRPTFPVAPPLPEVRQAPPGDPSHHVGGEISRGRVWRFLGWKHAQQEGSEYVKHFLRPHARAAKSVKEASISRASGSAQAGFSPSSSTLTLPGFDFRPTLPADFLPTSVATGDFNGDGKVDWVVSNAGSDNLWVYLGRGDGTTELPSILPVKGLSPVWVEVADLRGNGILDLVVAEADSGTIGVFLGNGDGTFAEEVQYLLPGLVLQVLVRDFNGDGHLDALAALFGAPVYGPVTLLPGDGTGRLGKLVFSPGTDYFFLNTWMDAGDIDSDGDLDVVFVDYAILNGLVTITNTGNGQFKEGIPQFGHKRSDPYLTAKLGDVDSDGCLDLVSLSFLGMVHIFKGNCAGAFSYASGARPFGEGDVGFGLDLRDVNGDGNPDLLTSGIVLGAHRIFGQEAGNYLAVLPGDGRGGFTRGRVYRGEPSAYCLATADVNGDGALDVLTANQDSDSVTVYLNDGTGGYGGPQGLYIGYNAQDSEGGTVNSPIGNFRIADVDRDGDPDLIVAHHSRITPEPYQISVQLNSGGGKFGPPIFTPVVETGHVIGDFVLGDFRNSGNLDFLAIGVGVGSVSDTSYISFAPGRGDGTFGLASFQLVPEAQGLLGIGDFNGDGKLDFVAVRTVVDSSQRLTLFAGNGNGTFSPLTPVDFGGTIRRWPRRVHVGDFNRDGRLDVMVALGHDGMSSIDQDVFQFLGNGDGTFAPPRVVLPSADPFTLADVNGDSLPDVIETRHPVADYPELAVPGYTIRLGQTDGTYALGSSYTLSAGLQYLPQLDSPIVGDVNGDGKIDILATQLTRSYPSWSFLQVLLGNGDGTFTLAPIPVEFNKQGMPQQLVDLTGDGRADLLELTGWRASFNVVPAIRGPALQLRLVSEPVIGTNGTVRITLGLPSPFDATITLTTSDPAILIPASVTIPAGNISVDVPFQIGTQFDPHRAFYIRGQYAGDTATVYGTQALDNRVGFRPYLTNTRFAIIAGQTTNDYRLGTSSLLGYSTSVSLSCRGLPAGASCVFGRTTLQIPSGGFADTSLVVATTPSVPIGTYTFDIIASDTSASQTVAATVDIGDFSLSVTPASQVIPPSGLVSYTLNISPINNFNQTLNTTCTGLPAGATCDLSQIHVPGTYVFNVQANSLAVGNYPFSITAVTLDGLVTRSTTAELRIGDFTVTPPSTTSATLSVGQFATFNFSLTAVNGFNSEVSFSCSTNVSGINCQFSPNPARFDANGQLSTVLTLTVVARPSAGPGRDAGRNRPGPPPLPLVMTLLFVAALFSGMLSSRLSRKIVPTVATVCVVLLLAGALVSCGGGGGGGASPSPPPPPPPPPGPQPVTVSVNVSAFAGGQSKTLATLQITVR